MALAPGMVILRVMRGKSARVNAFHANCLVRPVRRWGSWPPRRPILDGLQRVPAARFDLSGLGPLDEAAELVALAIRPEALFGGSINAKALGSPWP